MSKKLRQKNGETLMETLVSLLIAVLSVVIISTAVLATNKINQQTKALDEAYQSELQAVEGLEEDAYIGVESLSITFESKDGATTYEQISTEVMLYGNDKSAFLSYDYEIGGEMP